MVQSETTTSVVFAIVAGGLAVLWSFVVPAVGRPRPRVDWRAAMETIGAAAAEYSHDSLASKVATYCYRYHCLDKSLSVDSRCGWRGVPLGWSLAELSGAYLVGGTRRLEQP